MIRQILLYISIALFLFSCEEIEVGETDPNVAVVESYISPGDSISVKVYKQLIYGSNDTIIEYLDELNVMISDGSTWFTLAYSDSGLYINKDVSIAAGQTLNLEFNYNEKLIESETIIPTKPEGFESSSNHIEALSTSGGFGGIPEPVDLNWLNPEDEYHMLVVECIEDNPSLINELEDEDDEIPARAFRNAPTLDTTLQLMPMIFQYYGSHRLILYKLNPEYAALYEQLGTSSLDITAPPSNIENGLGIFTGVNSDTLLINVVSQ